MPHGDAERLQERGRTDARKLQQLRRLQRPRGEDHFATRGDGALLAALPIGDAGRPKVVEQDPRRMGAGLHAQVGAVAHRLEIRDGRRGAQPPARRELVVAGAFLPRAVEIVVARDAELAGAGDHRLDERMRHVDVRRPERPVRAVVLARPAHVVLERAKPRKDVREAPSVVARRRPGVVVLALAANGDQAVDRGTAAERAAARPVDPAAVHRGLGLRVEAPVHHRVEHRLGVTDRNVDPRVGVARARLEQQHAVPAIRRKATGEDAARGTGADDDVIETCG